jgi:hypothetical protein
MKAHYRLFRRQGTYYCEDTTTGRQTSLRTKDEAAALTLLHARNEAARQPCLNLQLARAYLTASDPLIAARTWREAIDALIETKRGATRERWVWASRDQALATLYPRRLLETQPEHLLAALRAGPVSTHIQLRRLHNFCLAMGWLPWPLLHPRQWPAIEFKEKRAVTAEEHRRLLAAERNPEVRDYYEVLWHLGGSQSDMATLTAEHIDWPDRVIGYARRKTGSVARLHFGDEAAAVLARRPGTGKLFPTLADAPERQRAEHFRRLCRRLGITGITLHSYRYAWAERARCCGFPERFAQEALGHYSSAVHHAYARRAQVVIPAMEDYERRHAAGAPPVLRAVA